jgi:hypothetical protein
MPPTRERHQVHSAQLGGTVPSVQGAPSPDPYLVGPMVTWVRVVLRYVVLLLLLFAPSIRAEVHSGGHHVLSSRHQAVAFRSKASWPPRWRPDGTTGRLRGAWGGSDEGDARN